MSKKYLMVSLEDEETKNIAEVLVNKTAKKILKHLADNEASESDIAEALNIPVNTVEYNLNKLIKAGFVEKANFFWSKKGKKIEMYKLTNKSVLISPKSSLIKSVVPVALLTALGALVISIFSKAGEVAREAVVNSAEIAKTAVESAGVSSSAGFAETMPGVAENIGYFSSIPGYAWFLLGAWLALVIFLIWNWRKL